MKAKKRLLFIELLVLYVIFPMTLALEYSIILKIFLVLFAFSFVLYKLKVNPSVRFEVRIGMQWKAFLKRLSISFLIVVVFTTLYVWFQDKGALFFVPVHKPKLFLLILFVYTIFSVWPQEIIYRTFFFERYQGLFKNKTLFVFINAVIFSLAHLFFRNTLVLIITFIGGIIFGYTYLKYRSTTAVTIEHALYGNWLFTVGMGQMLAFPGME